MPPPSMARTKIIARKSASYRGVPGVDYNPHPKIPHIDLDTAPTQATVESSVEGLGNDVLTYMIEFIRLPVDLRNLCLVNRQFRLLALLKLYDTLDLYTNRAFLEYDHGLLNLRNAGLKLVRKVIITPSGEFCFRSRKWVDKFVEVIPANQLRLFE